MIWIGCICGPGAPAQVHIVFQQLNTAHGLTDNYVHSMTMDKNGFLWIATGDGLNRFDGRTVQKYYVRNEPALNNDIYHQVLCDSTNFVWALHTTGQVTLIDGQRRFRPVKLSIGEKRISVRSIVQPASGPVWLFTDNGFFRYDAGPSLSNTPDTVSNAAFTRVEVAGVPFSGSRSYVKCISLPDNKLAFHEGDEIRLIDLQNATPELSVTKPGLTLLSAYDATSLLVYDAGRGIQGLALQDGRLHDVVFPRTDQRGRPLRSPVINAALLSPGKWVIATYGDGLYLWDEKAGTLTNYRHHAADAGTIINDQLKELVITPEGWVFAGGSPHGISYANFKAPVRTKAIFLDGKGNAYNGHVNSFASTDGEQWYLAAGPNLIGWNRRSDSVQFIRFIPGKGSGTARPHEVLCVAMDERGRLWIATDGAGLFVFHPQSGVSLHVPGIADSAGMDAFGKINHMVSQKGSMYISTRKALITIDTKTLKQAKALPPLQDALLGKNITRTWTDDRQDVWAVTMRHGVFRYQPSTGWVHRITKNDGLPSGNTFAIYRDAEGYIYIGTDEGLGLSAPDGSMRTFTTADGLLNRRVEATIPDAKGRIWIGNDAGIVCYDPSNSTLKAFDERYGLSEQGFRINSYSQAPDGTLFWGTEHGIQFFQPETLYNTPLHIRALVGRIESGTVASAITATSSFTLPAGDNSFTIHFTQVEYSPNLQNYFRYRLNGIDTAWTRVADQYAARYTLLPPGKYSFHLQASHNGIDWANAENAVMISIVPMWYQHPLIKGLALVLMAAMGWGLYKWMKRRQALQREEIETEAIINYFASQINTHHNIDSILWDVARNCISRLHFEDCVIYLLDAERNVLVQKAAFGPKGDDTLSIKEPIEIPVGKGIVGSVASTGKAEMIGNTSQDPRYIVDDRTRSSELTVPLIVDGKVIGVIDSEHSRKNFFTGNHLRILNTVAVLCANQIQRAKAEQEKQQAVVEGILNKQQAAEYRLQSLRLQMNPHFLFNALNSIQQMILANEELIATRYLSRFSKLLRAILVHSDKEMVTLQEEIDMIGLYIELESVRFKDQFHYTVGVENGIDTEELRIPTLLVQPFVENAIWHGLMHKDGEKKLEVMFEEDGDFLICTITDNGIGRKRSAEISAAAGRTGHQSKGILVSTERLKKMQATTGHPGTITITDLYDADAQPAGTKVVIQIPV